VTAAPLSQRSHFAAAANRPTELLAAHRRAGRPLVDLSQGNPTRCGLVDPESVALIGAADASDYRPEPLGDRSARLAVQDYYHRRGIRVPAERVVLSASTSEAYGWLFKLLADPGDALLVPEPSYPLLPMLAQLESVRLLRYPLIREERWRIDLGALERQLELDPKVRGVVLVHPNNPTGSLVRRDDAEALGALASRHGVALIVDEVFVDYLHGEPGAESRSSFAGFGGALCFVLSGLSKVALLPQLKLGWLVVSGPDAQVERALERLELLADAYLSVATPVQLALDELLRRAEPRQAALRQRLAVNLAHLDTAIAARGSACPLRRLPLDAGWYALVELPRTRADDEWVARLLDEAGVFVQPGYFFDFAGPGTAVVSLLPEPAVFEPAIERAVAVWAGS
jgi:aspartate/methionine/tyrosine aminotransferase